MSAGVRLAEAHHGRQHKTVNIEVINLRGISEKCFWYKRCCFGRHRRRIATVFYALQGPVSHVFAYLIALAYGGKQPAKMWSHFIVYNPNRPHNTAAFRRPKVICRRERNKRTCRQIVDRIHGQWEIKYCASAIIT